MPKLTLDKSILVNASPASVFENVRNFKLWPKWSPWISAEPDCKLDYAENGDAYSWDGKIIGSGGMQILSEKPNRSIHYELTFLKPWKSTSKVSFTFAENGDATEVHWTMDGSLPFFLFFLKNTMTQLIGMDYERGLAKLKDLIELDSVPSVLEFLPNSSVSGFQYIGINTSCSMSEIGERMGKDVDRLNARMREKGLSVTDSMVAFYHKWDVSKGQLNYTIANPVNEIPSGLPSEFTTGEMPTLNTYRIKHTGPYRHIGNAWSAGTMHSRAKLFKQSKKHVPFEVYENDPANVPEEAIVTSVHFPLR